MRTELILYGQWPYTDRNSNIMQLTKFDGCNYYVL